MTRSIHQFFPRTKAGNTIPGSEYTVKDSVTGLDADIFDSSDSETPKSQPYTADGNGKVSFYVEPGIYNIDSTDLRTGNTGSKKDVPIGVSRREIDDSNSVKQFDKTYATVADMKADTSLQANDSKLINTVDYYSTQRGGGASYLIKTQTQAASEGDVIDEKINHTMDNSLFAILQIKDSTLNVLECGAHGDSNGVAGVGNDDIGFIQNCVDTISNNGGGTVIIPALKYRTTKSIFLRDNVTILAHGSTIYTQREPAPQGNINSAGYCFNGECADDDYDTYSSSTGELFTTSPRPFVDDSDFKEGETVITAKNTSDTSDLSSGDWIHIGAGQPTWHPAVSEFVQVKSVSGASITLKTPIQNRYDITEYSLSKFIRQYDFTESPGGGGTGYPDMSTWEDAGFRKVDPVKNAKVIGGRVEKAEGFSGVVISFMMHLAVDCYIDCKSDTTNFWCIDSQDCFIKYSGGRGSGTHYPANGCNNIGLDVNTITAVAIEEGAQRVYGRINSTAPSSWTNIQAYCSYITDLSLSSVTPSVQACRSYTVRGCVINVGKIVSKGVGYKFDTADIYSKGADVSYNFASGEAGEFFSSGSLRLAGGEVRSSASSQLAVEAPNVPICLDNVTLGSAVTGKWYGSARLRNGEAYYKKGYSFDASTEPAIVGDRYHDIDGVYECISREKDNVSSLQGGNNDQFVHSSNVRTYKYYPGDGIKIRLSDFTWYFGTVSSYSSASKIVTVSPPWEASNPPILPSPEDVVINWTWRKI